ncbi:Fc.00g110610.m01.CDS01 [Cosmosporella sp. VM-42]
MSNAVSAVVFSVAPYHIISYGTLLGTSFFHTFINGIVMFKTVNRPAFSAIQQKLFPIYFGMQTVLPVIMALTFPGNSLIGLSSGVSGLLSDFARWHSLVPIATMFVTGLVNFAVLLPATTGVMKERRGQAKRDGKEWFSEGPHSDEMKALNKRFGMLHGISSLINVTTFLAALAYGFTLGGRVLSVADLA